MSEIGMSPSRIAEIERNNDGVYSDITELLEEVRRLRGMMTEVTASHIVPKQSETMSLSPYLMESYVKSHLHRKILEEILKHPAVTIHECFSPIGREFVLKVGIWGRSEKESDRSRARQEEMRRG